ncbi:MAG: tetratricopeptide repeat protein, partial [Fidelibacterota bacterium]
MKKAAAVLFLILTFTWAVAGERIGYTYPGTMIMIPITYYKPYPYFLKAGFMGSIRGFSGKWSAAGLDSISGFKWARGIYFDIEPSSSYSVGLNFVKGITPGEPIQYGLHFQRRVITYEDMAVAVGVSDVIFQETANAETFLQSNMGTFSYFAVVSKERELNDYMLKWYIGFGSDRFAEGLRGEEEGEAAGTAINVFAGFDLETRPIKYLGPFHVLGEYDGLGINLGAKIELTREYTLSLAIINSQNIFKFGNQKYWEKGKLNHSSAIVLGLDFILPRKVPIVEKPPVPGVPVVEVKPGVPGEVAPPVPEEIQLLRDSLEYSHKEIETLNDLIALLQQKISILKDSVQVVKADKFRFEQNINAALKHLSKSLRFFYAGDYDGALREVETAIEYNPNLALAYARRGSIYYKLGDIDRATMNWNMALQIDPEYDDVRNILRAMSEHRLRTT